MNNEPGRRREVAPAGPGRGNDASAIDCGGEYQCNAVKGYDGPTGLGTPNGLSSF